MPGRRNWLQTTKMQQLDTSADCPANYEDAFPKAVRHFLLVSLRQALAAERVTFTAAQLTGSSPGSSSCIDPAMCESRRPSTCQGITLREGDKHRIAVVVSTLKVPVEQTISTKHKPVLNRKTSECNWSPQRKRCS